MNWRSATPAHSRIDLRTLVAGSLALLAWWPPELQACVNDALLGGTPVLERIDVFGGDGFDFVVSIHTSVYWGPEAVLPDSNILAPLEEGESYLIYLIHNEGETDVDIFGMTNPESLTIPAAGILPADIVQDDSYDADQLVNPVVWFFGIDLISFAWDAEFGLLGPGQWAIVFFRCHGWRNVTGWMGDFSEFELDFGELLGPSMSHELPPACPGDINCDGAVDPLDLGAVLSHYFCPVGTGDPECDAADVNDDGMVNPLDQGFVLAHFGDCP